MPRPKLYEGEARRKRNNEKALAYYYRHQERLKDERKEKALKQKQELKSIEEYKKKIQELEDKLSKITV